MSTTTTRTLSSSYVPRNRDGSRPASPALSTSYQPRTSRVSASPAPQGLVTPKERAASSLRHEVKEQYVEREVKVLDEKTLATARGILDLLSDLPVPLPGILGKKVLKKPYSPPKKNTTFTDHVHRMSGPKKRGIKIQEVEEGELVGLGLSLESRSRPGKRQKTSLPDLKRSPELARPGSSSRPGAGPVTGTNTPGLQSRRPSANRRESGNLAMGSDAKETWSRDRWSEYSSGWNARAIMAKRYGDAMVGGPRARPEFLAIVKHDVVGGNVFLVDCVLLFMYSFWCTDQSRGRVQIGMYTDAQPLLEATRKAWEHEMRRSDISDKQAEMNKGMVGLLSLTEAICYQQMNIAQSREMHARRREFAAMAQPPASTQFSAPNTATHSVPGPAASDSMSSQSHSPPGQPPGPSPVSSSSSETFQTELLPLISGITETGSKAAEFLQTSRFHLSLRILRDHFPNTYESALTSDLSAEALPVPEDTLGSGRTVDPDRPDHFAWPIELGMSAAIPNLVSFGRSMLTEYAETYGLNWDRQFAPAPSS